MTAHKLSMADEAVITDLLAKNSRLEEEIEYLHNEIISMKTGPYSELLKENRNLRHELAVLVHGIDAESERLREQLTASCAREAKLRGLVTTLWDLLDDIDTASDIAKSDDKLYRGIVDQTQRKRWATGITSDGYTLTLPVANDDTALKEYEKKEYERGWDDGHIAGREKISGLKEYRRKVLLEAAERIGSAEFMSSPEASKSYAEYNELRRMAEEE